jgi:hypothetical protein
MLLIVIAALATALVVQHERAARREAELHLRAAELQDRMRLQNDRYEIFIKQKQAELDKAVRRDSVVE